MAVFINQPDALSLMAQVEGGRWHQHQLSHPRSETGFLVWFSAFCWRLSQEGRDELERNGMDPNDLPLAEVIGAGFVPVDSSTVQGVIYGAGGYNRYKVLGDGEIVFLSSFAVDGSARSRAASLGFSVR